VAFYFRVTIAANLEAVAQGDALAGLRSRRDGCQDCYRDDDSTAHSQSDIPILTLPLGFRS
jgi:hypothetical protein